MFLKIIFNLLAFTFFIFMFFELIRKNDTNYIYLLILQFIGILIEFIEIVNNINLNNALKIIKFILSIAIPILVFLVEYTKKISFTEILYSIIANYYILLKDPENSKNYLIKLIDKYPNSRIGHKKLANLYESEDKINLAIEEYEKAIELEKNNQELGIKLGKLYAKTNRNIEAKQLLADILTDNPENYDASILLADILYNEKEYKDAILIYTSALKYKPADYELFYYIGMTYTMLNDFQKAKENYEKAAQLNSYLFHAKYTLGQLNLIYGEMEDAKKYFQECTTSEEVEAGSYYYLARIAIIKGELDNAIQYANIAIEDDSDMYDKIQQDNIFITIREKINKPNFQNENYKKMKQSKKEKNISEHLDNTCKLVGKLNNNDIQMIENVMKTKENEKKTQEQNEQMKE